MKSVRVRHVLVAVSGLLSACIVNTDAEPSKPPSAARSDAGGVGVARAALTAPFTTPYKEKIGAFGPSGGVGTWLLDRDGDGVWENCLTPETDRCARFGSPGDIPIVGRWSEADPYPSIGTYRPSDNTFYLDFNGDGYFSGCRTDRCYPNFATASTANQPVVGYWNNWDHQQGIGIYRNGTWWMDENWDGVYTSGTDRKVAGFGTSGSLPAVGRLAGDSSDTIDHLGYFSSGTWFWDKSGNFQYDGSSTDRTFTFGSAGDKPVVGKWLPTWSDEAVGTYRPGASGTWFIDRDQGRDWDGNTIDDQIAFGDSTISAPVTGNWPPVRFSSDGDNGIVGGSSIWETSTAVVPPGVKAECPAGRVFIGVGGAGTPPTPEMWGGPNLIQADLDCTDGGCVYVNPQWTWASKFAPSVTTNGAGGRVDVVGQDNVTDVAPDGTLYHVRGGSQVLAGRDYGVIFVWRSLNCGNSWTLMPLIRAVDTAILGGHCGLPQFAEHPAVFRPSDHTFYLDDDGDNAWTLSIDKSYPSFVTTFDPAKDYPVMGQWDVTACTMTAVGNLTDNFTESNCLKSKIGMFQAGTWHLDRNGDGLFSGCTTDLCGQFGQAGDIPLVGKWNAPTDNRDLIGVWRNGAVFLDLNGNFQWDDNCALDGCTTFGNPGDKPVAGIFNANPPIVDRKYGIGTYRPTTNDWFLDSNDNANWDNGVDRTVHDVEEEGVTPVAGYWGGSKGDHLGIGTFKNGLWTVDRDGDGVLNVGDETQTGPDFPPYLFGGAGDIPLVGYTSKGWYGGWDRPELKVDKTNGQLFVSAGCDFRDKQESAVLTSTNSGASWKAISIAGYATSAGFPLMMTTARGSRLYVYSNRGGTPTLWVYNVSGTNLSPAMGPVSVGTSAAPSTGTLDWVTTTAFERAKATPTPRYADGSEGVALVGSDAAGKDYLYVTYPIVTGGVRQELVVNKVSVSTVVSTSLVDTIGAKSSTGSVTQAALVEGPSGLPAGAVRGGVIYWKETETSTGDGGAVHMRAVALSESSAFATRENSSRAVSTKALGAIKTWDTYDLTGDYVKGASFLQNGTPSYFLQWIVTPSGTVPALKGTIVRMYP